MHISSAIQLGSQSAYAKEIVKHEANFTQYGAPGRLYEFRAYPTMLYRATRGKSGPDFEGATAHDDAERERHERSGFVHGGKAAALAALERQEFEYAELAANRAYTDRSMSDKARTEAAKVDEATVQHLPAIPDAKERKR
jgi:hypothetical protein